MKKRKWSLTFYVNGNEKLLVFKKRFSNKNSWLLGCHRFSKILLLSIVLCSIVVVFFISGSQVKLANKLPLHH